MDLAQLAAAVIAAAESGRLPDFAGGRRRYYCQKRQRLPGVFAGSRRIKWKIILLLLKETSPLLKNEILFSLNNIWCSTRFCDKIY